MGPSWHQIAPKLDLQIDQKIDHISDRSWDRFWSILGSKMGPNRGTKLLLFGVFFDLGAILGLRGPQEPSRDKYTPFSWLQISKKHVWVMLSYAICCMGMLPSLWFASIGWLVGLRCNITWLVGWLTWMFGLVVWLFVYLVDFLMAKRSPRPPKKPIGLGCVGLGWPSWTSKNSVHFAHSLLLKYKVAVLFTVIVWSCPSRTDLHLPRCAKSYKCIDLHFNSSEYAIHDSSYTKGHVALLKHFIRAGPGTDTTSK